MFHRHVRSITPRTLRTPWSNCYRTAIFYETIFCQDPVHSVHGSVQIVQIPELASVAHVYAFMTVM